MAEVFAMRKSQFSVLLGVSFFLAGNPGLADDGASAVKSETTPPPAAATVSPSETVSSPAASTEAPTSLTKPDTTSDTPSAETKETDTAPGSAEADSSAAAAAALEPHKRPVPEGYATAAELFKQRKFSLAQKEFEKIIQSGTADVNTHLCLAHCFLQQKIYSKAVKEFDWLAKYAKNSMTLQKSCEHTARSLRNAMSGICPANCIKPNDPRWTLKAGSKVIQFPHSGGGYDTFTPQNIGQLIVFEHGNAVVKGTCPVCEGATSIPVLKDGGPMPRI